MSRNDDASRVLSTLNSDGSRRWLRPRFSPGRFARRRKVVGWSLIALFIALPYIEVRGKPAVLLDIVHREFTLFGKTFLATDTLLLMLAVMSVLVTIFLLTAIFGRVWCGWGCPQTVYLELLFRPLERWIEGGQGAQVRLDREGPNGRRVLKYAVFFLISLGLAHVFLAYFVGVDELSRWVRRSPFEHPTAFFVMAGVTSAVFFDFAYFREQTCLVACPYGRFQSALLDRDSLIVGYDSKRGEPRTRGKKNAEVPTGDCVDCYKCVATCPTGIDIRDGLQMECVHCTQCIDACDAVMDKIGRPRGLIRYSSQNEIAGNPRRLLRPRVILYPLILLGLASTLAVLLVTGSSTDVSVVRPRGATFNSVPSGDITNRIRIRITNRDDQPQTYHASVFSEAGDGPPMSIKSGELPATLAAGEALLVDGFVVTPTSIFEEGRATVTVRIVSDEGFAQDVPFQLLGPWTARKGTSP